MQCKIIATAFNPKRIQKGFQAWPHHGQVLDTPETYIKLVHKTIELEVNQDPGLPMDTYVVVYADPWNVYEEWRQYDGLETKRGHLYLMFIEEDGGSYLMYNQAYQSLRIRYDWFLFTCDDILVLGQDYYLKVLEKWKWNTGYIGLQGVGDHVQGSIGLTHTHVLSKVCDINNGELPHPKGQFVQERNIHEGELPFTYKVREAGFDLISFNDSTEWNLDNLCFPYHNYIHL